MTPQASTHLRNTRKQLGDCAKKIKCSAAQGTVLTTTKQEMIIGLGTARDWIRWSAALADLKFSTPNERKSARAQGIRESVRFNQLWTSTNALFAKDSILTTAATGPVSNNVLGSEAKRFALLYDFAAINAASESSILDTLNNLLSMECKATGVLGELKADGTPTMWEVIYHKYMRPEDRKRGLGSILKTKIARAKQTNSSVLPASRVNHPHPVVDGPTLIYAARNWAVHGMLLTSFFRGSRQKYITFINNITLLLAAVLDGASRNLLAKL